jgi:TldD protein
MTNTFLMPGQTLPEDIIRSVDRGLYVVDLSGGQVDITSGQFVFSTSEAYLIEQGRITRPVKGASLVGDGLTVLQQISAVGSDWSLDPGLGVCGKSGQSVPVGVGQPTVKVAAMTVGGQ